MSLEADLKSLWSSLVAGRFYADVSPDVPAYPLLIWQQVGGRAGWYVENRMPDHKHCRIQLHTWAKTRLQANQIARAAEKALCESGMVAQPYGAITALYEDELKLYGCRQDFGIWFRDP